MKAIRGAGVRDRRSALVHVRAAKGNAAAKPFGRGSVCGERTVARGTMDLPATLRDTRTLRDGACSHHGAAPRDSAGGDMARAEAACRANGARLTPIRRKVLEALQATRGALGAYDLADALADEGGRRLAPITIYRALDFLMAQGLAHRLASRNAYLACRHQHGPDDLVAFLICEACGEVEEEPAPGLAGALSQVLAGARFDPHLRVLEVSGRCAHCRPEPADRAEAA